MAIIAMCKRAYPVLRLDFPQRKPLTPCTLASSGTTQGVRRCKGVLLLGLIAAIQLIANQSILAQTGPIKTLDPANQIGTQAPARTNAAAETPTLDPILASAKSLADKGAATEAERSVRQYLAVHPYSGNAHFLLGYILFREIQVLAAASAPSELVADAVAQNTVSAIEPSPANVSGSPSPGTHSSANLRDKVATPDPGFSADKAKASLAEFTQGAKYQTPSAFDLKIVGFDYVLLADYSDADKWLTKMLQWAPNDSEGWYYLGRTKYSENRFEEAVHAFQQALRLDPNNVKAEDNLGLSFVGLGRVEDATKAYQSAIAWQKDAASKNSGPFIDIADLLLDQNRSSEAVVYLKQAIEISPRDFKAHELLGKAYARANELPQAQNELEQAIALAPQNPNLPCMLGPIYRRQGLMDKAKLQFDRCSALNGTHSSPETSRP